MAWSVARGAAIGFSVVLAILIAYAVVSLHHTQRLKQQDKWVSHSYEVLGELEALISSLKDAETGQRGYDITTDENYLEPYKLATRERQEHQVHLENLLADDPEQLKRLKEIESLADQKMAELQVVVDQVSAGHTEQARQTILSGRGKRLMDELRDRADALEAVERGVLDQRTNEAYQSYVTAIAATILGLILTVAALAVAWYLIRRELNARILASRSAHEQKERLLTTLTSIGDAVIVSDSQGRLMMMNPVAERLTGWGKEAISQPLAKVFHIVNENTRAIVESPVDVVLKKGIVVGLANHTVLIAKDGSELPIDDSGAPIRDDDGRIIGVVLVFRDVTDRRRAEVAQEALNAELREADRRKDHFLATLAHELRNPLAPLANALELWPKMEDNRAEMEKLRQLMERQVQQMIRLIDDLLDLSRITRGKVHLRPQHVDVATLIHSAVETVGPFINRCGHELIVQLPPEPVLVEGDVARLVQVMANIIDNAAKYTGRNGKIWISAACAEGEVAIKVRDNGPGIPPETLPRIFDMFTQGDHTIDRAHGGLGIGLTLVRNLVELHGGSVSAASAGAGQGSEFTIRLPSAAPPVEAHSPQTESTPTRTGALPPRRVLVVDDVQASAKTLAMMLRAIGQNAETRFDGPSAIEAVCAMRPDVVFMDVGMPKMDGYEVARRLRQLPELADLILVAVTGYGQDEDRRQALEAGFNYHLVKPASLDTLEQLLQTVPTSSSSGDKPLT